MRTVRQAKALGAPQSKTQFEIIDRMNSTYALFAGMGPSAEVRRNKVGRLAIVVS
jgi:hypothetical protein